MTPENWTLKNYLPVSTNDYCFRLWQKYQFQLKISAPRKTKLGDYRFRVKQKSHLITINGDLNPYTFLVVYLHEVAHFLNTIKNGLRTKPHGAEWQTEMVGLLDPLMEKDVFPEDISMALKLYLKSPKAASCSDPALTRVLRRYSPPTSQLALEQIAEGAEFVFQTRRYKKLKTRRTRVSCLQIPNKRIYLISKLALVDPIR